MKFLVEIDFDEIEGCLKIAIEDGARAVYGTAKIITIERMEE